MARTRYRIYEPDAPHFVTTTVVGWLPLFGKPHHARVVLDTMTHLVEHDVWTLHAYVVMENHVHLIAQAPDLRDALRRFKSFTGRTILDDLRQRGNAWALRRLAAADGTHHLWQSGSQPKQIEGEVMLLQKITYVHENPVKRGYVDEPSHWRYSSARDYEGRSGLVPVTLVE